MVANKNIVVENDSKEDKVYSLEEAIQLTGHGRYNHLVLVACCIISNAVAVDMYGFTVVLAAGSCDLQLSLAEIGALASAPFCGVIFAFPWGFLTDTRGRRLALLLSTSVGFVLAALNSFAWRWEVMIALRIIGCSFSTASFSVTTTYLGECTGPKFRDRYLCIMNSMNLASEIVSYSFAYLLLPLPFNIPIPWLSITYRSWRLLYQVLSLGMGIGALMMVYLQESPKFLADRGDVDKTLEVLSVIYETNGGKKGTYPVKHLKVNGVSKQDNTFWQFIGQQTLPIFRPPLLWRTLQLSYLMVICISTSSVMTMWFATIVDIFFKSVSGVSTVTQSFCKSIASNITTNDNEKIYVCNDTISANTIYSGIIFGLFYVCLTVVVSRIASHRRLLLITSCIISAICSCLLNIITHPIAVMTNFILMQATVLGIGSVSSYFVDLYPTTYRGLGTSLSYMVARLVTLAGINVVGAVIIDHCTATFYSATVFIISGAVVACFLPPERKNKS